MTRMPIEERRRLLIAATIAIVAESGIAAATTRAIAARAEMPLASFHYAFTSQQELMLATLHRLIETEMTEYNGLELPGDTFDASMQAGLLGHLEDVIDREQDYRSLVELSLYVSHQPGHHDLPLRYRRRRTDRIREKLAAVAERLGQEPPGALDALARGMVLVADGLTLAVLNGVDPDNVRATVPHLLRTT